MDDHSRSRSRRGRPPGEEGQARRRLLDAAAVRFAGAGFAATSLRQVARDAGVTPAMVAYYFQDKSGLLEAVLVEGLERVLDSLRQALAAGEPGGEPVLPRFVRAYLTALSRHPWMPRIVVQEVVSRDSPLRALFVERFADPALELIAPMLRDEMRSGRLRADLDPRLTLMSVIGMCVFPYLAEPLLGRLLHYRIDESFAAAFAPHTVALLERGLAARP